MTKSTQSKEITHFHGPEAPAGHHFHKLLNRIREDSIEVDELVELLTHHPASVKSIYAEIETVTTESNFHHEIRSLKHAILLLGMNRVQAVLVREIEGPELNILRTA